jgi:hypothetical protein
MTARATETAEFNSVFTNVLTKFQPYDLSYSLDNIMRKMSNKDIELFSEGVLSISNDDIQKLSSLKVMNDAMAAYKASIFNGLKKAVKATIKRKKADLALARKRKRLIEERKAREIEAKKNAKSMFAKLNLTREQKEILKKMVGSK